MIYVGKMKSRQLRKLFRILQYSLMQNLRIFRAMEGIFCEFTTLSWFWKFWKNIKPCGAHMSAPLFERRRPDRAPASRPWNHCHSHHNLQPPPSTASRGYKRGPTPIENPLFTPPFLIALPLLHTRCHSAPCSAARTSPVSASSGRSQTPSTPPQASRRQGVPLRPFQPCRQPPLRLVVILPPPLIHSVADKVLR
jgi:hypothetical protein